jgi:hypothetical protein
VPWAKSAHRGPAHGQNWHAWLGPQHWHKIDPAARKRAGRACLDAGLAQLSSAGGAASTRARATSARGSAHMASTRHGRRWWSIDRAVAGPPPCGSVDQGVHARATSACRWSTEVARRRRGRRSIEVRQLSWWRHRRGGRR